MVHKNNSELLEQAKWGKLSPNEIDSVAQQLGENIGDRYTLIHILGRARAIRYRSLIESFLYYTGDPMLSKIALQSLCTYWNLTKDYLDELKMFVNGVEWDKDDDVRLVAISIAGEYLRSESNTELLRTLIDVFENMFIKNGYPELIRSCAYYAIARAIGREYDQIPSTTEIIKQLKENIIDIALIEKAKSLIK